MLMETGTEEIAHIEMLATAIALNLEGASAGHKDQVVAGNPIVGAIMGGMNPRHYLSAGLAAMPVNSSGVPFDMSHIYASGNIVADMYCNVAAESTGRALACRLYASTDDAGMKDMLAFMIARDTMHQQQWLAVIEELGGDEATLPIPDSFPQAQEKQEFSYAFISTGIPGTPQTEGRWTSGKSLDGNGEFSQIKAEPYGDKPKLAPPVPQGYAETQQMASGSGILNKIVDAVTGK